MRLSDRLAAKIAQETGCDSERQAVIAYGLLGMQQLLELLGITLLIGGVFRCVWEALIIFLGVGLLKRCMGGSHCDTYLGCTIVSSVSIGGMALLCRYLAPVHLPKWVSLLGLLPVVWLLACIAWPRVPQESKNKPIRSIEKKARLRRQFLITVIVYLTAALLLLLPDWLGGRGISLYWAVLSALCWQSLMLTGLSGRIAGTVDSLVNRFLLPPVDPMEKRRDML